jgi:hypothetical protein
MLENLESVPWEQYDHAYGPATDVPQLIRDLNDPGKREDALDSLNLTIWHQGTIYEATVHAIPFLLEVLEHGTADRAALLVFLRRLYYGQSDLEVHQGGLLGPRPTPEELELERSWVRAVVEGVRAGSPLYLRLLDDPDTTTRLAAAYLLVHSSDRKAEVAPRLLALAEQAGLDEVVRAGCVYCLGHLAANDQELQHWLRKICASAAPLSLRAAAAIYVIRYGRESPLPEAGRAMAEALDGASNVEAIFAQFPWPYNDVMGHAVVSLTFFRDDALPFVPKMAKALVASRNAQSMMPMVDHLLWLVLGAKPFPKDGTYASCSAEQKQVLDAIADSNAFWGPPGMINIDLFPLLERWHLPRTHRNFQAFINGKLAPKDKAWDAEFSLQGDTIVSTGPDGRQVITQLNITVEGKKKKKKK